MLMKGFEVDYLEKIVMGKTAKKSLMNQFIIRQLSQVQLESCRGLSL